ncbi:putative heme iron utilization protein [Rheinheimera pacifica]|nr:putative heme iron utilization protein [Rheinheimera pacifica]
MVLQQPGVYQGYVIFKVQHVYPKQTTNTGWFNAFTAWLTMHGMFKRKE